MSNRAALACFVLTLPLVGLAPGVSGAQQNTITVENRMPDPSSGWFVTEQVVGLRPASNLYVAYEPFGDKDALGIPTAAFSDAASQFPEVRKAAEALKVNIKLLSLPELRDLVRVSGYETTALWDEDMGSPQAMKAALPFNGDQGRSDAVAITNFLVTGVVDASAKPVTDMKFGISVTPINKRYAGFMKKSALQWTFLEHYSVKERAAVMSSSLSHLAEYVDLEKSLLFGLGPVTYGAVFPQSAKEAGLVVPERISKKYDVYWLEYAVTFRDLPVDKLDEVDFVVSLPTDHYALSLLPLSYGKEVSVETQENTPDVNIEAEGVAVSLGEFFKKTIRYSYLKPTIVAYGLRENEFSWTLRDDAIASGSHEFVAITAVPKGEPVVDANVGVIVKTKSKYLIFDGDVGSTRPKVLQIRFK